MAEFPPPAKSSGAASGDPGYAPPPDRPGFVFPPPRQSSSLTPTEAGMIIGEQMRAQGLQAQQALEGVQNLGVVVEDYGPQITDLIENRVLPWAVPTISPLSQTINRRADATFQLSDLATPVLYGTTDQGGHNHTHTMSMDASRMYRSGSTKGNGYLAFLTPAITREYEQLNFMLGEGTTSPAQLDIAVYVVDPDTRTMTRQVHKTDVAAGLPIGESVVTVTFDKWVAVQGSYVAVAFLWHGSGDTRHILGIGEAQRPLPTEIIFPAKISARHANAGLTGLPSAIDGTTQVSFDNWYTPYAELSENIGQVLRSFIDKFETPANRDIERPWVHLIGASRIRVSKNGYAYVNTSLFHPGGVRVALYDTPLATDRPRITVAASGHADSQAREVYAAAAVRTTNNMLQGVGVFWCRDKIQIRSWSLSDLGQLIPGSVVRASTSWALGSSRSSPRTIRAAWDQGVITVYDEQDQLLLTWNDTTTPAGPSHRFVGIVIDRYDDRSGPSINEWAALDIPAGVDEDDEDEGDEDGDPAARFPPTQEENQ